MAFGRRGRCEAAPFLPARTGRCLPDSGPRRRCHRLARLRWAVRAGRLRLLQLRERPARRGAGPGRSAPRFFLAARFPAADLAGNTYGRQHTAGGPADCPAGRGGDTLVYGPPGLGVVSGLARRSPVRTPSGNERRPGCASRAARRQRFELGALSGGIISRLPAAVVAIKRRRDVGYARPRSRHSRHLADGALGTNRPLGYPLPRSRLTGLCAPYPLGIRAGGACRDRLRPLPATAGDQNPPPSATGGGFRHIAASAAAGNGCRSGGAAGPVAGLVTGRDGASGRQQRRNTALRRGPGRL